MNWQWQVYRVILRLHTPLHVGWGKVSYLQRARPYVTGRVLRGALVSRVARNQNEFGDDPGDPYRKVSKTFAQFLTFTYFYPALRKENKPEKWEVCFPWDDEPAFRRRFLSSYAATSLDYPRQTAAEGLLYETEFLSPYTLDAGERVYLMGYVFVNEERLKREKYDWQSAFRHLQLGGERGYGWGEARLEDIRPLSKNDKLFGLDSIGLNLEDKRPILHLGEKENQRVLAHVTAAAGVLAGPVEPMVGREWRADNKNDNRKHVGQHLAFNEVRFAPGSVVLRESDFVIGEGGYWAWRRHGIAPEGAPQ
jgi:hypothetical protein